MLRVLDLVDGDDVVCVLGFKAKPRGFRDCDGVASLGPWMHRG